MPAGGRLATARPETAAPAPVGPREGRDLDRRRHEDRYEQQLRDPLTDSDRVRLGVMVDDQHLDFAAVAGVDQSWAVGQGDALTSRQARARDDESGPALRDGDG